MKHRLQKALTTALVLVCASGVFASNRPHVTVRYRDQANINPSTLSRAARVASEVFERAGIILDWEAECPEQSMCGAAETSGIHVVFLLSTGSSHPCPTRCSSCALRSYDGSGGTIFVLYDRAQEEAELIREQILATASESANALVLGYFAAHEIGHLLLPNSRHAITGIMVAHLSCTDWRFASRGTLRFLPGEAAAMRTRISSRVARRP